MGNLVAPNIQTGWMHNEAPELDRKLRQGDGLLWSGDPRLYLAMGVIEANKRVWVKELGRYVAPGEIVGRRYEVWRHNEDGTDAIVSWWRLEDFDKILLDLAPLRMDSPAHESSIDLVKKNNARVVKEQQDAFVDAEFDAHAAGIKKLVREREGRNFFPMSDVLPFKGLDDTVHAERIIAQAHAAVDKAFQKPL